MEIVRHAAKNMAGPQCASARRFAVLTGGTSRQSKAADDPAQNRSSAGNQKPRYGETHRFRNNTGPDRREPLTAPDIVVSLPRQQPADAARDAFVAAAYAEPAWYMPRNSSRNSARVVAVGTARQRRRTTTTRATRNRPSSPPTTNNSIFFAESSPGTRCGDFKLDSRGHIFKTQNLLNCGDVSSRPVEVPSSVTRRWTWRWAPDGDFYLMSYGRRIFVANPDALLVKFS